MSSGFVMRGFRARRDVQPLIDRMVEIYVLAESPKPEIGRRQRTEMAREARELWWQLHERLLAWTPDVLENGAIPAWPEQPHHVAKRRRRGHHSGSERRKRRQLDAQALSARATTIAAPTNAATDEAAGSGVSDSSASVSHLGDPPTAESSGPPGHEPLVDAPLVAHPNALPAAEADNHRPAAPPGDDRSDDVIDGTRRWRLEALKQVRILVGRGYKKIAALAEVAGRINHSVEDLQRWERDLVGTAAVENELYCAELVGEFDGYFRTAHYSYIPNYRNYGSFEGVWNMERAARLSREIRYLSLVDIGKALRNVH